ncbi:metal ABC transporter substrate-binding protein [Porticoccus sp. W117]|uniref:metal ABC transporter substrate-binding protein n=1 Tax=Porticoccus sp. W117 TaxID=3054777 RepID=UPI002598FB1C|nr:metal ABC transporter substrate-binding protein [Porticoccus sp. W117]MDM3870805.1 metal ABC transporter substrate-binding protein [Porticoccus sp. W117]
MARLLIAVLFTIASCAALANDKPTTLHVVTTIKPLTMIAEDIAGDRAVISQLIPAGSSPHGYAMKISDRRKIQQADLLLWIGDTMDGFVGKIATDEQISIAADQLQGVTWPASADHHHNHAHGHHSDCGCEHGEGGDPHIWLNPNNAVIIASELAKQLGQLDPANHAHYQQAAERFAQQIKAFDKQAKQRLAQLPEGRFVVQHDAYGHFINRYGLDQLGSLRSISGAKAGAKTMATLLAAKGQGSDIACLLTDPQFDAKAADTFSARTGVKQVALDPLGHQVATNSGELNYLAFLNGFVDAFQGCLAI